MEILLIVAVLVATILACLLLDELDDRQIKIYARNIRIEQLEQFKDWALPQLPKREPIDVEARSDDPEYREMLDKHDLI